MSYAKHLLSQLSLFFIFESSIFIEDDTESLMTYRRKIELAHPVLEILASHWSRDEKVSLVSWIFRRLYSMRVTAVNQGQSSGAP